MVPRRRSVLLGAGAGLALLPTHVGAVAATADVPAWGVDGLLAGGLRNPLGLQDLPRLSWQLRSSRRGARQSAWWIGVASSQAAAAAGRYDLWDSGRIAGEKCFDVAYAGTPLAARQRAWWRITAWDERGTLATSLVAFWEMGLLTPGDWSAAWLSAETPAQREDRATGLAWRAGPVAKRGEQVAFRLRFDAPQDGEMTALIGCGGNCRVRLDRTEIIAPKRVGWGSPGPRSALVPVAAGAHVLTIETRAPGDVAAQAAALLRLTLRDGRTIRIGGEQLESRVGAVADSDSGWSPTSAVAGQATMPARAATLLRRPFRVDGRFASARLYLTALGMYEAELNGKRLDDALLRPEFTDYRKHCLYCVEDVTDTLVPGDNVLGVHVADGWYGSYI